MPNRDFFFLLAQENLRAIKILKNKVSLIFLILFSPLVLIYLLTSMISFIFGLIIQDYSFTVGYHVIGQKN